MAWYYKKLYKTLPQIKGNVEICELSTALFTKHFNNYNKGEIYGLDLKIQKIALYLIVDSKLSTIK